MKTLLGRTVLLAVVVMSADVAADETQPQPSPSAEQLDELLSWLPPETETLAVLRDVADLKVAARVRSEKAEQDDAPPADPNDVLLGTLYGIPALPLYELREGKYAKPLAGKKLRFVVEASCRFRMVKKGPGGISVYDGCHLFVFDEDLGDAGDTLTKSLAEDALATETLEGHTVAKFEQPIYETNKWTYFVTLPRPNMLLIATDREYLRELLVRMKRRPREVAFPADSRARRLVEPDSRFFAIRRIVSPEHDDKPALDFVCTYVPNDEARIKFRYLSEGGNAGPVLSHWRIGENFGIDPPIEVEVRRTRDVVELTLPLNRPQTAQAFWLMLWVELGHAISI